MAIIRTELQGAGTRSHSFDAHGNMTTVQRGVYDVLVESAADLGADPAAVFGIGSMAYCLGDGKLYVKKSDGTWGEAAE